MVGGGDATPAGVAGDTCVLEADGWSRVYYPFVEGRAQLIGDGWGLGARVSSVQGKG